MPSKTTCSTGELMATVMMRHLQDGDLALVGAVSMIPMLACRLARASHAPNLSFISGGTGAVNADHTPLAASSCDENNLQAEDSISLMDVIALQGQGRIDVFFAGGLQIDQYGNSNTVCVGSYQTPRLRGPGVLGLPFNVRVGRCILYTMNHTPRTFVEQVDFIAGPGHPPGGKPGSGQLGQGPVLVVTPLSVMDFNQDGRMRLHSVHPGVTPDQVQEATGFELDIPDGVPQTEPPRDKIMKLIRQFDSNRIVSTL